MSVSFAELKAVVSATAFKPICVFDHGSERYALMDQDQQIVGLVERDAPYYIESLSEATTAAKRGLHSGPTYKGYNCAPFGLNHYILTN